MGLSITLPNDAGLVVIDVQCGFDDDSWGPRNNPDAESNVARLLGAWRAAAMPVFHVHHDSLSPDGCFRPGTAGNLPKSVAVPLPGEAIYRKSVNSAFIGTALERDLRFRGVGCLVIVGLTSNHCVSTTARMAGNLGFETYVVADATATFARLNLDGTPRAANDVHLAALSDLQGEFAVVVETGVVLRALKTLSG